MKIQERIFNSETGETVDIEREETPDEKIAREKGQLEYAQRQAESQALEQVKSVAIGKLAALGLTTDDLRALGL